MFKPGIADVRVLDNLTMEVQNYLDTLQVIRTDILEEIYKRPTIEQQEHWMVCMRQCELESGTDFGITSYNKSSYVVIWKTSRGIRMIFPFDSILITNRAIIQWYDYMDAVRVITL